MAKMNKGFLKALSDLSGFMDTYQEWHAFVHGWSEIMCPWRPFRHTMKQEIADEVSGEFHYYMFGRAVGFFCLVGFIVVVVKTLRG